MPLLSQAFRDDGVDVAALDPREAGQRLQPRAVRVELAAALDAWAEVLRPLRRPAWKDRVATARILDPDPFRDRVRDAVMRADGKALTDLAAAEQTVDLPAPTLVLMVYGAEGPDARERTAALLKKAQRLHPDDFWVNFTLAGHLMKLKKPPIDEVIRYTSVAVALRPDSPVSHDNLGEALRLRGRPQEAVPEHRTAIRLQDNAHSRCGLATALTHLGKPDEAVAEFREAIRLQPDYAVAYCNLGVALKRMGRLDEAIEEFKAALRLDPDDAESHMNLGNVYKLKNMFDESIREHREAIRLDKNLPDVHYNLGNALKAKGDFDEAMAAYKEAIRQNPNDAAAHSGVGGVWYAKGRPDEAVAAFREAVRLEPNDIDFRGNLAVGLLGKRAWAEAIAAMNEVLRLDPKRADVLSDLACGARDLPRRETPRPGQGDRTRRQGRRIAADRPRLLERARRRPLSRRRLAGGRRRLDQGDELSATAATRTTCFSWPWPAGDWARKRKPANCTTGPWPRMEKNDPKNEDLLHFRAEAEKVLELKK